VRGFLPPVVEEVQGGHWVVVRQGDEGGAPRSWVADERRVGPEGVELEEEEDRWRRR
jgi:hypothetical protein